MKTEYIIDTVPKLNGDFFPSHIGQVPQFQYRLKLGALHSLDPADDILFQFHKLHHILINLVLQVDDLDNGILHPGAIPVRALRHIRICHRCFGGQIMKVLNLSQLALDPLVQSERL